MKNYKHRCTETEVICPPGKHFRIWACRDFSELDFKHPADLWALYNATREKLEELYPGCIFPVPEDEVDADVMRAFSDMQEEYRSMLVDETE